MYCVYWMRGTLTLTTCAICLDAEIVVPSLSCGLSYDFCVYLEPRSAFGVVR
jgi:hypothetical protein